MSLPDGFLEELRTRLPLSRVIGRKVVWDNRRSNPAKGDFWAPCPFHQEKTASFHVDDRKGVYYCFGCHAKGDAVAFLRETEGLGFRDAVEVLAREAGMSVPARDPAASAAADRRAPLLDALEAAVGHYRLALRSAQAAEARAYLTRRGLSEAALDRFGIGFAPDQRQGLLAALAARGIPADVAVAAGLAVLPEGGGAPYDRFRGRIIFPIRDLRGRAISLGGRALDPAARAKYLNGPETALFDKGRQLFNAGPARAAAGSGAQVVLVEGYMDVVSIVEAGFPAAVAPLGTAVTEEQLRLLWTLHPEPVVALDGDAAGVRAALRLADLALPHLGAGQGLRFAVLPAGMDPDDIVRRGGRAAFQAVLDRARPMVALLWERETDGKVFDSPERRAALDRRLRAILGRIGDAVLRSHYETEFRALRAALFGSGARPFRAARGALRGGRGAVAPPALPTPAVRASALALPSGDQVPRDLREALILATLALHPGLLRRFESALEMLESRDPGHAALASALLAALREGVEPEELAGRLARDAPGVLERLMADPHVRIAPSVRVADDAARAERVLAAEFARLQAETGAAAELADAVDDFERADDERLTWRLAKAGEAVRRAGQIAEAGADDFGEDRAALSADLQRLIDAAVWERRRR